VTFNFEDSRLQSFAGKIFNGEFKDFTESWYDKVGSVYVQTLFVIGLSPVIDCALKIIMARYKYYSETGSWFKIGEGGMIHSRS
jgi:hypothetical protein